MSDTIPQILSRYEPAQQRLVYLWTSPSWITTRDLFRDRQNGVDEFASAATAAARQAGGRRVRASFTSLPDEDFGGYNRSFVVTGVRPEYAATVNTAVTGLLRLNSRDSSIPIASPPDLPVYDTRRWLAGILLLLEVISIIVAIVYFTSDHDVNDDFWVVLPIAAFVTVICMAYTSLPKRITHYRRT